MKYKVSLVAIFLLFSSFSSCSDKPKLKAKSYRHNENTNKEKSSDAQINTKNHRKSNTASKLEELEKKTESSTVDPSSKICTSQSNQPSVNYKVTVLNGFGSNYYCPNDLVEIKADKITNDLVFETLIGDTNILTNLSNESPTFKMPKYDVNLEAKYIKKKRSPTLPNTLRIIPIGDSITQGINGYTNWRCYLWKKLRAERSIPTIDFVGSEKTPYGGSNNACSDPSYDGDNEGHWGWKTDEVLNVLKTSASQAEANIALIHMGTNDIRGGHSNESTVNEISAMIDLLRIVDKNVVIFVAGIIPNIKDNVDAQTRDLNRKILNCKTEKSISTSPVIFVDHFTNFNPNTDLRDKIHPNSKGNEKISEQWFQAILKYYSL